MYQEYEQEIHTNRYGQVDIDYYVAEAKRLRNEAIAEAFSDLGRWIARHLPHRPAMPLRAAFHK